MKRNIVFIFVLILIFIAVGCSPAAPVAEAGDETEAAPQVFADRGEDPAPASQGPLVVSAYTIDAAVNPGTVQDTAASSVGHIDSHIPTKADGTPMFSDALTAALEDPELEDALFDVWIRIGFKMNSVCEEFYDNFRYEGKSMAEWKELYLEVLRAREAHKMELHSQLSDVPYFDKWSGSTPEASALEAQWDADWQRTWEDEHPGELYPITTYEQAQEVSGAGCAAAETAFVEAELSIIEEAGIELAPVPGANLWAATLTKEQVLHFPVSENIYAYTMIFAEEYDCAFDGRRLYDIGD